MNALAEGRRNDPHILDWLSKTTTDAILTSTTSDSALRISGIQPDWLPGSTIAVPGTSAATLPALKRRQRNRSVDNSSIISTNDGTCSRDLYCKQPRRKTRPDKYDTKKQPRVQGTDQAERLRGKSDRLGISHSKNADTGKKRRKNIAGAAQVADMPHSPLMSQGRISLSRRIGPGMFGNCRESDPSSADLTFPEVGKTTSIKIPRDAAAHSKKVQREREEVSSFFPPQTNPSTMASPNNDTSMLDCREVTEKPSEQAMRPRRRNMIDDIGGEQSPLIAKDSRHGSYYALTPAGAASGQCSSTDPVDARSCCSNPHQDDGHAERDELYDKYTESLIATGVFRNTGIHFKAHHMSNITNSSAGEDDEYGCRLARLKGMKLRLSPEMAASSGLVHALPQPQKSHDVMLDGSHYESDIILTMSPNDADAITIPQEQNDVTSDIAGKLNESRNITRKYGLDHLQDAETRFKAYNGSLTVQPRPVSAQPPQYSEQQRLRPMNLPISTKSSSVSELCAAQKTREQHPEWVSALVTSLGPSQPDLDALAAGHKATEHITNRQTNRPQSPHGDIAEHGPAEHIRPEQVGPLREANGNDMCDNDHTIHTGSHSGALTGHVDVWYPDEELTDMQHDYQYQPCCEQTTDLLDGNVTQHTSLLSAWDCTAQANAEKHNVVVDDIEHQDMLEFWRPNCFRAL